MRAAAALSEHPVAAHATGEVVGAVLDRLSDPVDLLTLFVSASHAGSLDDITTCLRELVRPRVMIGATACGVIAQTDEVEDRDAIAVWAASGIDAAPLRIEPGRPGPDGGGWPEGDAAILLADPFTVPAEPLLAHASHDAPGVPILGGFASAAMTPGGNRLVLDGTVHRDGAVGVVLSGCEVESVVSQGCRPIGEPFTVTGVKANVITELGSRPPLERLQAVAADADRRDRALLAEGVHIGVVIDESQPEFARGDFLIRGVLGADPEAGAIAIGAEVPIGTTLQFHVRDADSATEDLEEMLTGRSADAALTFTCNGRGMRLFGRPGHDAELIHGMTGSEATGGMFCAGELGPVRGTNHVHGFTASSLLLRDDPSRGRPGPT